MNQDTLIHFREASKADLPQIINLLIDDELGKTREALTDDALTHYQSVFDAISKDENAHLIVATQNDQVIAVAQINFLIHLTYQGGKRAQIEGVRVDKNLRGAGIGKLLIEHLIKLSIEEKSHLVQLTTNKQRTQAKRFYESLGFIATHEGMKLDLSTKEI